MTYSDSTQRYPQPQWSKLFGCRLFFPRPVNHCTASLRLGQSSIPSASAFLPSPSPSSICAYISPPSHKLYRVSQFYHARRLIGLALGIYPKLGTSLAKICLLVVEYISLIPCATSSIHVRHTDCSSLVRRDSAEQAPR
jgi:hypothetical protein